MTLPPPVDTRHTLVSADEVRDIELVILKRMKELAAGTHTSVYHGSGFDFVGLRDWQPGDRLATVDWSQSTLTNFSPMVTREFEQQSTARVVMIADTSLSTRCGVGGVSIATVIARAVATLGLAGAFFQDQVGLITFDGATLDLAVRPQIGRNHAIHCLESYQAHVLGDTRSTDERTGTPLAGLLRRTALVPVVSDFLFDRTDTMLDELAELNHAHDVFLVMVESAFAFDLPPSSAGWIEGYDVETGRTRMISAVELERLGERIQAWQDTVARTAHEAGLQVLRIGSDEQHFYDQLVEFFHGRRRRKR